MKPPESELELARIALAAAHGRFSQDAAKQDIAAWFASLGETLWWIFALDEHYWHRDQPAYEPLRNYDEDGFIIPGLRLARNRVGHGLALMLEDPDGRPPFSAPPSRVTIRLSQLRWRQLENLPPVEEAHKSAIQQAVYQDHLAGNPVRFGLRHASRFFIRRHAALDSAIH